MRLAAWMITLFFLLLAGCSNEPAPEERMSQYIKKWNDKEFNEMYDQLTADSKEKISEEEFVKRYKTIYEDLGVEKLKISVNKTKEKVEVKEGEPVKLSFSASMETLAGPVEFEHEASLVQEEKEKGKDWFVQWDPSFIFPQLKEGEEVRVISSSPKRGQLFDRNGEGLAVNAAVNEIGIVPQGIKDKKEEVLSKVTELLPVSKENVEQALGADWVRESDFVPIAKVDPANKEVLKELLALPGVQKREVQSRYYPLGEHAAHLVGYVRPITAEQLEEQKGDGYSANSMIGTRGLEQVYENELRGEAGWRIQTSEGEEVIAEKPAKDGRDLHVTIDSTLQTSLSSQLKKDKGTAAAIHPLTGETLALVSMPSYNPNNFLFGWTKEEWDAYNNGEQGAAVARFNKLYSPGSAIKPLTAVIGLETGKLDPVKQEDISGLTWSKDGWGSYEVTRVSERLSKVNLKDALVTSDNIYFARASLSIGAETFESELEERFAFGEELDFYPFPTEPSSVSNNGIQSEGQLADSGFGQGEVLMSPLHAAASYTVFHNQGDMIQPYLEKREKAEPSYWKKESATPENAALIMEDLKAVISDPYGTGHKPEAKGIELAGKTGTAELKLAKGEEGKENGWFVASNTENPRLLVAMMIEDVKERGGSHYVVPKVKSAMSEYLKQN
ncbi:penicillin-binding transpeptidase domain-containing protein [Metabacillus sp. 84]|uniref:penicillin-binding transpeptidase domain-containing protein n=1 Tax=Metabacillus sp. 84 TaxID=3404705 RepID=UPI003CF5AA5E